MDLLRFLKARRWREQELAEELRSHLEMAARDRVERGEAPEEARFAARREFGNVKLVADVTREMWRFASLERIARQTRHALRGMARTPGFTIAAALTLAVGLAAATIIFSVVNTVLLRPLPFPQSDRIVTVSEAIPFFGPRPTVVTLGEYLAWRDSGVFSRCAALEITSGDTITGAGTPERLDGAEVTAGFFRVFGIAPVAGRDFRAGEDAPGGPGIVVLSHQLWSRKFHADPGIIGKSIHLGESLRTVIGVMPAGFDFPRHSDMADFMSWTPETTEYWTPLRINARMVVNGNYDYLVLGRLPPGIAPATAQRRLQAISHRVKEEQATTTTDLSFRDQLRLAIPKLVVHADPLVTTMTSGIRSSLWMLFAAVGVLLALIYANLAGLFLTRGAGRLREMAVRQSLGAGAWQMFQERLVEGAVFGAFAATLGILLTVLGSAVIRDVGGSYLPRLYELTLDGRVLIFLAALAMGASLLFGAVPWFMHRRVDLAARLHESGRTATGGRTERSLRSWLVASEIALSVVLLVGAGLLLESFRHVLHADPGFDTNNLLTADVGLPWKKFPESVQRYQQFERLLNAVRRLPGVESA